jgi:hypothetical protein
MIFSVRRILELHDIQNWLPHFKQADLPLGVYGNVCINALYLA